MQSPIVKFSLDEGAEISESLQIANFLKSEIESDHGAANRRSLTIWASRDGDSSIIAGLKGFSHWQWLYISHLWVAPEWRGQHIARKLIEMAESEAINRKLIGVYVDTFGETTQLFYESQGYSTFGKIANFTGAADRYFLMKSLEPIEA